MAEFEALAHKKVAGIPIIYLVAVIAAAGLYAAIKAKTSPDPPAETTDTGSGDFAGDLPDTSQPVFQTTPTIYQPSGVNTVTSTPQADTNDLWARRSIEWLIGQGNSVEASTTAITKYLDSESLSMDEAGLRDKAVKQYGLPPEGIVPTSTTGGGAYKGPFTAQGTPPCDHTVKGKSDDSFSELARGYYGQNDKVAVTYLRAANTTVSEPFSPGQVIHIPPAKGLRPNFFKATKHTHTLYAIAAKNGKAPGQILALNPGVNFPVHPGKRVRVG